MPSRKVEGGMGRDQEASKQALIKNGGLLSLQRLAKTANEGELPELRECRQQLAFSCTTVEMQIVMGLFSFVSMPCSA